MIKKDQLKNSNKIKKESLPKIITNIYGILAVMFVLIPEWLAEITLSISKDQLKDQIIDTKDYWESNPYLFVSALTIKELRLFACKLEINGYSSENQSSLKKRVLKKLKSRNSNIFKGNTKGLSL